MKCLKIAIALMMGAVLAVGCRSSLGRPKAPEKTVISIDATQTCGDPRTILAYMASLDEIPFKIRIVDLQKDEKNDLEPKVSERRVFLADLQTGQTPRSPKGDPGKARMAEKLYRIEYEWPPVNLSSGGATTLPAGVKLATRLETLWRYEMARGQDGGLYVLVDDKPVYRSPAGGEEKQLEESLAWIFRDVAGKVSVIVTDAKKELKKYDGK